MSKKINIYVSLLSLIFVSGCSFTSDNSGLRQRTTAETEAIRNQWYPIKSEECQVFVDSFSLAAAAVGNTDTEYLAENMEKINSNLEQTALLTSKVIFELALTTSDSSIRKYALEAAPLFAQLGSVIIEDLDSASSQIEFMTKFKELGDKVPDACKS
jgi:hypothetical protein